MVSRHPLDGMPSFERVTDLEPFIAGWLAEMKELGERGYGAGPGDPGV